MGFISIHSSVVDFLSHLASQQKVATLVTVLVAILAYCWIALKRTERKIARTRYGQLASEPAATTMSSGGTSDGRAEDINRAVTQLLERSRSSIADGENNDALAALLHAIRLTSGEASILGILNEAKKRVDDAHAQHSNDSDLLAARQALQSLLDTESILGDRDDILHDAFSDGSSVICNKCGSLVARARADAHSKKLCPALPQREGEDDDDDDDDN